MTETMSRNQSKLIGGVAVKPSHASGKGAPLPIRHDNDAVAGAIAYVEAAKRQWTLKGIPPSAVELSRDAAKRQGMKLNTWVSAALENAAQNANFVRSGAVDSQYAISINKRIDDLEDSFKDEQRRIFRKCIELEDLLRDLYTHVQRNSPKTGD